MIEQAREQTTDYFESRGWSVIRMPTGSPDLKNVVPGSPVLCSDERNPDDSSPAPSFFGGADGIAAQMPGDTHQERYDLGVDKILGSGFLPGSHGDKHHGDLGCAFRRAWIEGKFLWLPALSELEHKIIRGIHNFTHLILEGEHTANDFIINFEHGSALLPRRNHLVAELWYLLSLGIKLEPALELSAATAEILLPEDRRKLLIY